MRKIISHYASSHHPDDPPDSSPSRTELTDPEIAPAQLKIEAISSSDAVPLDPREPLHSSSETVSHDPPLRNGRGKGKEQGTAAAAGDLMIVKSAMQQEQVDGQEVNTVNVGGTRIRLKFGKRPCLEDGGAGREESSVPNVINGSSNKKQSSDDHNNDKIHSTKKQKAAASSANFSSCRAEGCKANLSNAKEYHRRHKVCEWHSKASKVKVGNLDQRFCQQCSRFHVLVEFDEGKRSCRRKLAGHNERRRKAQPEAIPSLHSASFSDLPDVESPPLPLPSKNEGTSVHCSTTLERVDAIFRQAKEVVGNDEYLQLQLEQLMKHIVFSLQHMKASITNKATHPATMLQAINDGFGNTIHKALMFIEKRRPRSRRTKHPLCLPSPSYKVTRAHKRKQQYIDEKAHAEADR